MNNRKAVRLLILMSLINITPPILLVYLITNGIGPQKVEHTIMYLSPYVAINSFVLLYSMKNRPKKKKSKPKKYD